MGFFKKIGAGIKKASKQISFKNLVKIGASFDPSGIVGGIQQAHQAKKDGKAEEAILLQQAEAEKVYNMANSTARTLANGALNGAYDGVKAGTKQGIAETGAELTDLTIKAWFTKHWKHLLMALAGIVVVVVVWKKFLTKPNRSRRR